MKKLFGRNNVFSVSLDLATLPAQIEEARRTSTDTAKLIETNDRARAALVETAQSCEEERRAKCAALANVAAAFAADIVTDDDVRVMDDARERVMDDDAYATRTAELDTLRRAARAAAAARDKARADIAQIDENTRDLAALHADNVARLVALEDKLARKQSQLKQVLA